MGSRQELQTRKDDAQSADGLFKKPSKARGRRTNQSKQALKLLNFVLLPL